MPHLVMPPRARERFARTARRLVVAVAVRVLDRLGPAALPPAVELAPAAVPAPVVAEPTLAAAPKLFAVDELPPLEVIDAAAVAFDLAGEAARAGDRGKRKARKLLDRLPDGLYGRWMVERVPSAKTTPDLEQIRADYTRAGLGEVPMRDVAPTLRVTIAVAEPMLAVAA
ncbi:hypothetical protein FF36_01910 [Frankia torreyi]|uniref:Uncharacterized protein n=1 Tax=Frankia torreyi TaxID=1856 RepID=A0A0D8BI49_9ACTN|nr:MULTISPECIES: hypothetical protein [Frankia]KJE23725.1 hypothetical protein FF36_01910 [Frankia torreyi]KQM05663.1 hypothetical protein FF86_101481 [Frankia sp. CpI1-P]